ncbi:hypothetical protein GCM10009563_30430 [Subtercola frigoramans]
MLMGEVETDEIFMPSGPAYVLLNSSAATTVLPFGSKFDTAADASTGSAVGAGDGCTTGAGSGVEVSVALPDDDEIGGNTGASDCSACTSGTTLESEGAKLGSAAATGDVRPTTSTTVIVIAVTTDEAKRMDNKDEPQTHFGIHAIAKEPPSEKVEDISNYTSYSQVFPRLRNQTPSQLVAKWHEDDESGWGGGAKKALSIRP